MAPMHDQRGVTLIEQLIALGLGGVMMTGLFGYFRSEAFHLRALETRITTMEDARGALDIMIRDLKNAGSWGTGSAPAESASADDPDGDADSVCNRVYRATATIIHVQMDLNGNGNCTDLEPRENLRYELTGPTSSCSGPKIIRRNGDCLVANAVRGSRGVVHLLRWRRQSARHDTGPHGDSPCAHCLRASGDKPGPASRRYADFAIVEQRRVSQLGGLSEKVG